jgi:transcription initiation factor TFIIE subunit alpha
VLDNVMPEGFGCHKCGHLLDRVEESTVQTGGQRKVSRLMSQLDKIIKLLQQIDESFIPENNFDQALSKSTPVQRDRQTNPQQQDSANHYATPHIPTAVRGQANTAPTVEVSLVDEDNMSNAERADANRKAALALQNALPVWHTVSTVTGDLNAKGLQQAAAERERGALLASGASDDKKNLDASNDDDDELKDYYDALARERQLQEKAEREAEREADGSDTDGDEFDDDGDDGDEFENVEIELSQNVGTPMALDYPDGPANGSTVKEEPSTKRVRIDETVNTSAPAATANANSADADSEEDEVFEDV